MNFCTCKFWLPFILLVSVFCFLLARLQCLNINLTYLRNFNYERERQNIIDREQKQQFGSSVTLTNDEERANQKLMFLKMVEYQRLQNNATYNRLNVEIPQVSKKCQRSLLYHLLRKMPKGAAVHVHDMALTNVEFLLELTYEKYLWLCKHSETMDYELLKFSLNQPNKTEDYHNITCIWHLLQDLRKTSKEIDLKLRKSFTITLLDKEPKEKVRKIEQLLKGLLTYAPIWRKYLNQVFEEFYTDNVQYLEIRSSLPRLYDLQGNFYTKVDALEIMRNTSNETARDMSFFYGSSFIYSLPKNVDDTRFELELQDASFLKFLFPDYLIGLDLVDEPELGKKSRLLKEFSYRLLELQDTFDYYLTVAATSWHDDSIEENILESYLLGTKRMTFTKELLHHPFIISRLVQRNIPIVISPIADQVFHSIDDLRDHPASFLFRYNLPLIISSDYPAYWKVDPLTYDFYNVFMKMAPKQGDLKLLKQLSFNSIYYSGLQKTKKAELLLVWQHSWANWICSINHLIF